MKRRIYLLVMITLLGVVFSQAQMQTFVGFDIRGRDCGGGRGICSVSKTSAPNNHVLIQKTGNNTFVLTISRTKLTKSEETSIAGKSFLDFQSYLPTSFMQTEDIKFGNDILKAIGFNTRYNLLKKDNYPMKIDETDVKITLRLSSGGKI